jgi:uncharacterized protein
MTFERYHKRLLLSRLTDEPRQFIQVIYGPRQVGKTTLIQQIIKDLTFPFHYNSADFITTDRNTWTTLQWEIARHKMKQSGVNEGLLVFDEIQKLDNWSEMVKKEWDADTLNGINLKVRSVTNDS